ncbi:MAG TPA: protein translocase subunit SecD [Burkholderiales bacterium]|nr:protein translocase subunit SecD [Burkholderiales bacterium]
MNRFPVWKYVSVAIIVLAAALYTLPNFFGEVPAVQVSSARATVRVDAGVMAQVEAALNKAEVPYEGIALEEGSLRVRLADTDTQLRAKDVIHAALNPGAQPQATPEEDPDVNYVVALNLMSASPDWLTAIRALPMYLGLDLRGGVHFLLQVDMQAATTKRVESLAADIRSTLRDRDVRHGGVTREGQQLRVRFRDDATRERARNVLLDALPDLQLAPRDDGRDFLLVATLKPEAVRRNQEFAVRQNIQTLQNRINELGVAEPIIQQQGADRIVVQLPGVQDVARAKRLIGRTATLEIRMVDEEAMRRPDVLQAAARGQPPLGTEFYVDRNGEPLIVERQVVLTGDRLTDAQPGFDAQTNEPAVHLRLDGTGSRIFQQVTRENVGRRMAILLIERGKAEVVTAPVIRSEIPGGRVQISGRMNTTEANDIALLLRAGSLAAPMEIVEERTVGPSLGRENIEKGFRATMWGFVAIVVFMSVYYSVFGVVSSIALSVNLLFLIALLSLLQATLTLPGIAAIALTLGMAIDANVLINERIREELRAGATPQAAIAAGYERAWGTILDSNVTSLIAGLALLIFGQGPVRGFAVVHCLGILTSMFSAVTVSRAMVNLIYGHRRRVTRLAIGNTAWK